ncbi:MAG: RNA pseudouridine synthase [Turneriella sp.]
MVFDASRILAAEKSFHLTRISKIVQAGHGCIAALSPLVVHEDNHQLVIYKPAGWLSQSDQTKDLSVNEIFAAYIREKYAKPGKVFCAAVQRLDRPAQGLMVLARTSKGAARISEQIRLRQFEKKYRVLTAKPLLARGQVAKRIVLSADMRKVDRMAQQVTGDGRTEGSDRGVERYLLSARLIAADKAAFHYEVEIEGGKYHQIRALFAAHGAPLLGDVKYGGKPLAGSRDRIALVASLLRYRHPTAGRQQLFTLDTETLRALPGYFI